MKQKKGVSNQYYKALWKIERAEFFSQWTEKAKSLEIGLHGKCLARNYPMFIYHLSSRKMESLIGKQWKKRLFRWQCKEIDKRSTQIEQNQQANMKTTNIRRGDKRSKHYKKQDIKYHRLLAKREKLFAWFRQLS